MQMQPAAACCHAEVSKAFPSLERGSVDQVAELSGREMDMVDGRRQGSKYSCLFFLFFE